MSGALSQREGEPGPCDGIGLQVCMCIDEAELHSSMMPAPTAGPPGCPRLLRVCLAAGSRQLQGGET